MTLRYRNLDPVGVYRDASTCREGRGSGTWFATVGVGSIPGVDDSRRVPRAADLWNRQYSVLQQTFGSLKPIRGRLPLALAPTCWQP